jgi:hypothetical protein
MQPLAHTCPTGAVPVGKNVNLVRPDSCRRGRYRWKRWSGHVTGFFKPSRQQQVRTGDEARKTRLVGVVWCAFRVSALCVSAFEGLVCAKTFRRRPWICNTERLQWIFFRCSSSVLRIFILVVRVAPHFLMHAVFSSHACVHVYLLEGMEIVAHECDKGVPLE